MPFSALLGSFLNATAERVCSDNFGTGRSGPGAPIAVTSSNGEILSPRLLVGLEGALPVRSSGIPLSCLLTEAVRIMGGALALRWAGVPPACRDGLHGVFSAPSRTSMTGGVFDGAPLAGVAALLLRLFGDRSCNGRAQEPSGFAVIALLVFLSRGHGLG